MIKRSVAKQKDDWEDYRLIAREGRREYHSNLKTAAFTIKNKEIGAEEPFIIAGPCAVYTREQILESAVTARETGAHLLRGGAYKPRTSPYSFQGLGLQALEYLAEAGDLTGLPVVTEVLDQHKVEEVGRYADVFQIGARNMQNFSLLRDVGQYAANQDKGVLLKTGFLPKLTEVLCAAEYVAIEFDKVGALPKIILCERGINLPGDGMRNTPRPDFLLELRQATYLPVIGDPSHSTGRRDMVARKGIQYLEAAANGLLIDIISDAQGPEINGIKVCDYEQGMRYSEFRNFMEEMKKWKVPQQ